MKHTVSIVIVSFNSGGHIARCLRSVRDAGEVVVVDNASSDDTCAAVTREAPGVKLIRNEHNRGFAAAVNQGVAATGNPFVLLLNPDTVLQSRLQPLLDQCLSPEVGAAGGKLIDEDGQVQTGFNVRRFPTPAALLFEVLLVNRVWPSNPVNRRYRCLDADLQQLQDVDQPAGAFLMVRRDVLEPVASTKGSTLSGSKMSICAGAFAGRGTESGMSQTVSRNTREAIRSTASAWKNVIWLGMVIFYASITNTSRRGSIVVCMSSL